MSLAEFGVPREFLSANLSSISFYSQHGAGDAYGHVRDAIRHFLVGRFQSLYFYGHNGSGKSYIACALLSFLYSRGIGVRCVSVFDLIVQYKANMWTIPPEYLAVDVLLLEELGKTFDAKNDIVTPPLERLIKTREESGLRTIYTANCGLSAIEEIHGPTIVSMIKGKALPVKFPDIDWRVALNLEKIRSSHGNK